MAGLLSVLVMGFFVMGIGLWTIWTMRRDERKERHKK